MSHTFPSCSFLDLGRKCFACLTKAVVSAMLQYLFALVIAPHSACYQRTQHAVTAAMIDR